MEVVDTDLSVDDIYEEAKSIARNWYQDCYTFGDIDENYLHAVSVYYTAAMLLINALKVDAEENEANIELVPSVSLKDGEQN